VRKLLARKAIPYRKVGRLLRFMPAEIEEWSNPASQPLADARRLVHVLAPAIRPGRITLLPKSLIEHD
jgi:hypothetical protein